MDALSRRVTGFCENCLNVYDFPGTPTGTQVTIGGKSVYKASPQLTSNAGSTSTNPQNAIILLTDAFGMTAHHNQFIADDLAQRLSLEVYIPDLFDGRTPFSAEYAMKNSHFEPGTKAPFINRLKFMWMILSNLSSFLWISDSNIDSVTHGFVDALKAEKHYEKIGVIGYCLGGAATIRLAETNLVDTVVIAHPGPSKVDQVRKFRAPSSWICAEEDEWFPEENRLQYEAVLASRDDGLAYEFKLYKGTVHGFAARPYLANPVITKAFADALDQTVAWFQKTL
jgi:dienelactone hydrolase